MKPLACLTLLTLQCTAGEVGFAVMPVARSTTGLRVSRSERKGCSVP